MLSFLHDNKYIRVVCWPAALQCPYFDNLVIAMETVVHRIEPGFSYMIKFRCINLFFLSKLTVEPIISQLLSGGEWKLTALRAGT
jgi:hypothetical protein